MPSNEPMFSGADLGRLFSLADGTQSSTIKRWLDAGQLTVEIAEGRSKSARKLRITPAAVLAFVKAHPDAYDWRKISDPALKGVAEQVEKRDPLVPLDEAIAGTGIKRGDVVRLAQKGHAGVVTRWLGAQGTLAREVFIRRSTLAKLHATLEEERRRSDPFHALHVLIEADQIQAAPPGVERAAAITRLGPGLHAPAQAPVLNGRPVVTEEQRRCPHCGTRRSLGQLEDGPGWVLDCMTGCGRKEVLPDPDALAKAAADQAEREAIRSQPHGRGRPPKALAAHS